MSTKSMKHAIALGAAGALVAGSVEIAMASPSWALPVLPKAAALSTAASNQVTEVHYYRHGYRHGYYGRGYRHGYYGRGYRHGYYRHGYYRRGYYGGGYYPYYGNPVPLPFGFGWGW